MLHPSLEVPKDMATSRTSSHGSHRGTPPTHSVSSKGLEPHVHQLSHHESASKAASLNIKLQMLNWDKEHWDGVSQNMKSAFQVVSNNNSRLQTWTDHLHDVLKHIEDDGVQARSCLDGSLESLEETKRSLDVLTTDVSALKASMRQELDVGYSCTKQLLQVTSGFLELFLGNFEIAEAPHSGAASVLAPNSDELDSSLAAKLEDLESLSARLASQSTVVADAFDSWKSWRATKNEQEAVMWNKTTELQAAGESARHRLMQWRDILKESSSEISFLSAGLADATNRVHALEAVQVLQEHVEEAIDKKEEDIKSFLNQSVQSVNEVAAKLSKSISSVQISMENSEDLVAQQVSDLKSDVQNILRESLNPVSAYLNTMHVNASAISMEVGELKTHVPEVQGRIKDVSERLQALGQLGDEQTRQLGGQIDNHAAETSKRILKGERELDELQVSFRELRQDLAGHLEKMHQQIEGNAKTIEGIRHGEIPNINREFLTLEQKVAKWVRTDPMPSKINEARLYTLEARLAHEMESRFLFEESYRGMSSLSNVSSMSPAQHLSSAASLPPISRTPRGQPDGLVAHGKGRPGGANSARSHSRVLSEPSG